jgi:MYXO-CTERM domain-containing protein
MAHRARHSSTVSACLFLLLGLGYTKAADAATYYVAATGSDTNDGTSEATAWGTITYAATLAAAGDTVYVKAGLYADEKVVVANSGTADAPVVFQGYTSTPGDTPDPQYSPGGTLDSTVIPVLKAQDAALLAYPGTGFGLWDKSYVEIRNFGVTQYYYGLYPQRSDHITLDHIYATTFGAGDGGGVGVWFYDCDSVTLTNSVIVDAAMINVQLMLTHNSLVDNVSSYAVTYAETAVTDYHIAIVDGHNNTIQDCSAQNLHADHPEVHPGHGIGIKDQAKSDGYANPHSTANQIINCTATNTYESFFVAHECYGNTFSGCTALADPARQGQSWAGIIIRDGAHDNTFSGFYIEGFRVGLSFQETNEGPDNADQIVSGNVLINSVVVNTMKGTEFWNADDNVLDNCVFDNAGSWAVVRFPFERVNTGNVMRNSIVLNTTGAFQSQDYTTDTVATTYTDFWNNAFDMPEGTGNLAADPLFADSANGDYHLKSEAGRWDPGSSAWVTDTQTSPCIDTGDPSDAYKLESCPNGGRVDMGAYGNTEQASRSLSEEACESDSDGDPTTGTGGSGNIGADAGYSATGGSTGSGATADTAEDDSGCSCRTSTTSDNTGWLTLAALAIASVTIRRTRPEPLSQTRKIP